MKRIHAYVITVAALAVFAAFIVVWTTMPVGMPYSSWQAFAVLMLLGLVAERLTVSMESGGTHSVVLIPLFASALLFGGAGPVIFILVTGTVGEFLFRRKGVLKGSFNVAQYALSSALAGLAYAYTGGVASARDGVGPGAPPFELQLVQFAVMAGVLMVCNQSLVARAISIAQGTSFLPVWRKVLGTAGSNVLYDVFISPIAIVIALLGTELGSAGLFIAILPLLAIRHAYLLSFQLQAANRDLLEALVKAIETRDPYTSGHSRRVQMLAGRIAREMGLSEVRASNIESAALLHDIGKTESVFDELLKKPSDLSRSEREVIESHVQKGVDVLTSLSSFPKEVVEAVYCHHEREDGHGYPRGLSGGAIPLGAKIIAVCDAVDAMLSDRPYRRALPVSVVREELRRCAGVQFDRSVVEVAVATDLLEQHAAEVLESVESQGAIEDTSLGTVRQLPVERPSRTAPVPREPAR